MHLPRPVNSVVSSRPSPPVTSSSVLGQRGEHRAEQWYRSNGYEVLDRNWHCREGELDLVVRKGSQVVFCEVKTRAHSRFGDPALAVDYRKQTKLRRAAARWLSQLDWHAEARFDVASVIGTNVTVIENAF